MSLRHPVPLQPSRVLSMATIRGPLQNICLFCRIWSVLQGSFAEYGLFYRALLQNMVSFTGLFGRELCVHFVLGTVSLHKVCSTLLSLDLTQNIVSFIGLFCKRDLYCALVLGTVPLHRACSTGFSQDQALRQTTLNAVIGLFCKISSLKNIGIFCKISSVCFIGLFCKRDRSSPKTNHSE